MSAASVNPSSTCFLEDLEPSGVDPRPTTRDSSKTVEMSGGGSEDAKAENVSNHSVGMDSFTTAASTLSVSGDMCKICHCGTETNTPLIAPCDCCGSLKYVHQECLQKWIKSSDTKKCELCKYTFVMQTKVKPFCQWEKLDMSSLERRKLICSVTFHIVAITCVVWSLYVLIDRTAEEIREGELQWPFWTKLVVVAIGFTGGLVFMYIQCKVYVHLCRKWKAYNRIIVVQDAPEGTQKRRQSSDKIKPRSASLGAEASAGVPCSPTIPGELASPSHRNGSTCSGAGAVAATSNVNKGTTTKTNAETQTALRGLSLIEMIGSDRDASNANELAVVTVSKILEDMDEEGASKAIFFTECECDQNPKKPVDRSSSVEESVGGGCRGDIREPVLICDLPGQSVESQSVITGDAASSCDLIGCESSSAGSQTSC